MSHVSSTHKHPHTSEVHILHITRLISSRVRAHACISQNKATENIRAREIRGRRNPAASHTHTHTCRRTHAGTRTHTDVHTRTHTFLHLSASQKHAGSMVYNWAAASSGRATQNPCRLFLSCVLMFTLNPLMVGRAELELTGAQMWHSLAQERAFTSLSSPLSSTFLAKPSKKLLASARTRRPPAGCSRQGQMGWHVISCVHFWNQKGMAYNVMAIRQT